MSKFHFGDNLRRIRMEKGISQEAMAMKMNISQTKYSRIEKQAGVPDDEFVQTAAAVLDVGSEVLWPPAIASGTKKVKLACALTPAGRVAYRLLMISAVFGVITGLWDGAESVNNELNAAIAVLVSGGAFVFWYKTEKPLDSSD